MCAYKHRHTVTSFVGLRAYDLEFAASAALGLGALALALDLLRRSCARARAPSPRAASLLTLDLCPLEITQARRALERSSRARLTFVISGLLTQTVRLLFISAHFACTEGKLVVIQFFWYSSTGGFINGNGYLRSRYDSPLVQGLLFPLK